MKKNSKTTATKTIVGIEKGLLGLIALLTIVATGQELITIIEAVSFRLADAIIAIHLYWSVRNIGVFYASNRTIITLLCLLL